MNSSVQASYQSIDKFIHKMISSVGSCAQKVSLNLMVK